MAEFSDASGEQRGFLLFRLNAVAIHPDDAFPGERACQRAVLDLLLQESPASVICTDGDWWVIAPRQRRWWQLWRPGAIRRRRYADMVHGARAMLTYLVGQGYEAVTPDFVGERSL